MNNFLVQFFGKGSFGQDEQSYQLPTSDQFVIADAPRASRGLRLTRL